MLHWVRLKVTKEVNKHKNKKTTLLLKCHGFTSTIDRSRYIKIVVVVVVVVSFGLSFKRLMSTVGTTVTQRPLSPLWRPKRAVGQTPPPPFLTVNILPILKGQR